MGERSLSWLSELLAQINAVSLSQFVSRRCPGLSELANRHTSKVQRFSAGMIAILFISGFLLL